METVIISCERGRVRWNKGDISKSFQIWKLGPGELMSFALGHSFS